jgi:hypothetical protein
MSRIDETGRVGFARPGPLVLAAVLAAGALASPGVAPFHVAGVGGAPRRFPSRPAAGQGLWEGLIRVMRYGRGDGPPVPAAGIADGRGRSWRLDELKPGVTLNGADLRGADWYGVCLRGVRFRNCDLSRANLADADLRGVDLASSRLTEANLCGADLEGARLQSWGLLWFLRDLADLRGAVYDSGTRWPAGFDPGVHGARPDTVIEIPLGRPGDGEGDRSRSGGSGVSL